jgi:hypothetical protein
MQPVQPVQENTGCMPPVDLGRGGAVISQSQAMIYLPRRELLSQHPARLTAEKISQEEKNNQFAMKGTANPASNNT